jgi:hypothetical protein
LQTRRERVTAPGVRTRSQTFFLVGNEFALLVAPLDDPAVCAGSLDAQAGSHKIATTTAIKFFKKISLILCS